MRGTPSQRHRAQERSRLRSTARSGGDPGKSPKGDNARARYHTALGSMRETKACIDVARALGYVEPLDAGVADRIDHVSATLYRLAHPKK